MGDDPAHPKSLSVDDRDAVSLCSDKDLLFPPSVLTVRSRSESPSAQRGADGQSVQVTGATGGEARGGQHLFPEVIVQAVSGQPDEGGVSDAGSRGESMSTLVSRRAVQDREDRAGGRYRLHPWSSEEAYSRRDEEELVSGRVRSGSRSDVTLRYRDERSPMFRKSPSRRPPRRASDVVPPHADHLQGERAAARRLTHQNTLDSYLQRKSRYRRAQDPGDVYWRRERHGALFRRRCTSPVLMYEAGGAHGDDFPHYTEASSSEYGHAYDPSHERHRRHSSVSPRHKYYQGREEVAHAEDVHKPRARHGSRAPSARERRGMFQRNETVASVPSASQARRSRRDRASHARMVRKCSSMDLMDGDPPHPSLLPRARSEDTMTRCHCDECLGRTVRSRSSHGTSSHRPKTGSAASTGRRYRTRLSREKAARERRDLYQHGHHPSTRSSDASGRSMTLTHTSWSSTSKADHEPRWGKTSSSSESDRLCDTSSVPTDRGWGEGQGGRSRALEALGSSASDKDLDVSRLELFMKFFSQEVDLDDLCPEQSRFSLDREPDPAEQNSREQPSLDIAQHVAQHRPAVCGKSRSGSFLRRTLHRGASLSGRW